MLNKEYLLAFDPNKSDGEALHAIIKSSPYISDWWHYLPSTYILMSSYTLETIQKQILDSWSGNHFLMIEVNRNNHNGWLPQAAWDWLNGHRFK
jgi:hypothetical protein